MRATHARYPEHIGEEVESRPAGGGIHCPTENEPEIWRVGRGIAADAVGEDGEFVSIPDELRTCHVPTPSKARELQFSNASGHHRIWHAILDQHVASPPHQLRQLYLTSPNFSRRHASASPADSSRYTYATAAEHAVSYERGFEHDTCGTVTICAVWRCRSTIEGWPGLVAKGSEPVCFGI